MHLPDESMAVQSDRSPTREGRRKVVDFTVDSAGNVSPRPEKDAHRTGGEAAAPDQDWRRSG